MSAVTARNTLDDLAVRYRAPLLRFFRRRAGAGEEADDLVQDVFSRLAAQDLKAIANVDGYIFQIAANVLRDRGRRAEVRSIVTAAPEGFDVEDEAGFSPERILQSKEALRVMIAALYELPPAVRMVFSQYHFDEVAQVDIARLMGISLSTVEKNMAKANRHLLRRLRGVR